MVTQADFTFAQTNTPRAFQWLMKVKVRVIFMHSSRSVGSKLVEEASVPVILVESNTSTGSQWLVEANVVVT